MEKIYIMVNGLPGRMATALAEAASFDERFRMVPYALTGPDTGPCTVTAGGQDFKLLPPSLRDGRIEEITLRFSPFIAVDFTRPEAVDLNTRFYVRHRIPFVMGTACSNKKDVARLVGRSGIQAVVADNMSRQVAGFRAMVAHLAQTCPGVFGLDGGFPEAKATAGLKMPEGAPAFPCGETYAFEAEDGSGSLEFKYRIDGSQTVISGVFDAIVFLYARLGCSQRRGTVYTMADILKADIPG